MDHFQLIDRGISLRILPENIEGLGHPLVDVFIEVYFMEGFQG
jgi:hypothetical protein